MSSRYVPLGPKCPRQAGPLGLQGRRGPAPQGCPAPAVFTKKRCGISAYLRHMLCFCPQHAKEKSPFVIASSAAGGLAVT